MRNFSADHRWLSINTATLRGAGKLDAISPLKVLGRGYAIGPVVAPDLPGAQALVGHCCSLYAGKFLRIDVDAASGLPAWLEAQGLPRVDTATTMVRGGAPERGPAFGGWALVTQSMG